MSGDMMVIKEARELAKEQPYVSPVKIGKSLRIAFDVDGTLIHGDGSKAPRMWVIDMLIGLSRAGHYIIVWSGGGADYAESICRQLNIQDFVKEYLHKANNPGDIDVCFDDMDTQLAKTDIRVSSDEGVVFELLAKMRDDAHKMSGVKGDLL